MSSANRREPSKPLLTLYRELHAAWLVEIDRSIADAERRGERGAAAFARAAAGWPPLVVWVGLDLCANPRSPVLDLASAWERAADNCVKLIFLLEVARTASLEARHVRP